MKKLFLSVIVAAVVLTGCGQTDTPNKGSNQPSEPASQTSAQPEQSQQSPEPEKEKEKEKAQLAVGETFELKDWEVTLESFEFNQKVSDKLMSSSADEGNKFLVLNFTLKNNGTSADTLFGMIGGASLKAIFNEKYEYSKTMTMIDGDLNNEQVQPLASAKGFVVIEMPDAVAEGQEAIFVRLDIDGDVKEVKVR